MNAGEKKIVLDRYTTNEVLLKDLNKLLKEL
jgi:hypothetical protein